MKKNVLITMLALMTTMTMLAGCGRPDRSQAAEAVQGSTAAESTEETVEETTSSEETEELDTINETEPTEETTPETELEESKEIVQAAETPKPTTEPVAETGSVEPTEITTSDPATSDPVQAVAEQLQAPETPAYDVTAMSATMYVKSTVNLRQGPGTEYSKVGSLNKGDQVTVTGKASNGWYQLDNGAFVSDKYLDSTAPVVATTATTPGTTTTLPTEQAGNILPIETIPTTTVSAYVAPATEFFDYLNQQRSAAGLGTLTWDSDMATVAQRRAKELATDFSHNGNVERYNENIHTTNNMNSTYVDWYNSFYNSTAHRETMMNHNIGRGAAALYYDGFNNYYIICNFAGNPISAEEQLEQLKPENLVPAGESESGSVNSFSTTGETINPDDENYDFYNDIFEQLREQYNQ